MKRVYAFITAANQILLFVGVLAALTLIAIALYRELVPRRPEGVPIKAPEEASAPAPVKRVSFLATSYGHYFFGISRDFATAPHTLRAQASSFSLAKGYSGYDRFLNIAVSDGSHLRRMLLPHDGVVVRWSIADDAPDGRGFAAHVFECILEDTTQDGLLDEEDRPTLILIHPDLRAGDLRIDDAHDFRELSRDQLLVQTGRGSDTQFWIVDAATFARREIKWAGQADR